MADIYVSPTGSDVTGDGSLSNPYQTLKHAVSQASNGDSIFLMDGVYIEEYIQNDNKDLYIKSYSGDFDSVTIKPKTFGNANKYVSYWFNLTNCTVKFYDLTFYLDENEVVDWGSGSYKDIIHSGTSGNADSGVTYITRCFFHSNASTHTVRGFSDGGYCNSYVYKCTFRHFNASSLSAGLVISGTNTTKDTIFEDNSYGIYWNGGTIYEDHNCFYGNTVDIRSHSLDSTDITSDPQFVSSTSADILNTSPCKDAGVTIPGYIETYEGTAPDIGVFEIITLDVQTNDATNIWHDKATLNGTLNSLGGQSSVKVWFEWRKQGETTWQSTPKEERSNTGNFYYQIANLLPTTIYEFRAKASYVDGTNETSGNIKTFITAGSFSFSYKLLKTVQSKFYLAWSLLTSVVNSFKFAWKLLYKERLYHLLSFPLIINNSITTGEYRFTTPVAGCLDSISINVDNTGSSGNTVIKIYVGSTLKKTVTISATNNTYNDSLPLDNSLVHTESVIKVVIDSVATGATGLRLAVRIKTFPYYINIVRSYNVYKGVYFESPFYFGNVDKWVIILNQPVNSIIHVRAQKLTGGEKSLTASLTHDDYGDNKIEITPDDCTDYDYLVISVYNINNDVKIIHIPLKYFNNFSEYPTYVKGSFSFLTHLEAIKYYYSWDNVNWYGPYSIDSNIVTISHMPSSEGEHTLYIRYLFDDYGQKVVYDEVNITYYYTDVNASIDFSDMTLQYNDSIPPSKVEVYVDDELVQTLDINLHVMGFDTYTYDDNTFKLTLSGGSVFYKGHRYDFNSTQYTIREDITFDDGLIYAVIGFNMETKRLEYREIDESDRLDYTYRDLYDGGFVPIWSFLFTPDMKFNDTTHELEDPDTLKLLSATKVYRNTILPSFSGVKVSYKIYDVVDRTKTIEFNTKFPTGKDYYYKLRVTDLSNNEIKQGQIHFEPTLKFIIEEL